MRTVKSPTLAIAGLMISPLFFLFGFLTLFVTGVNYGELMALWIGTALILIGLVLLISGVVLIGVHRMLSSVFTSPPQP